METPKVKRLTSLPALIISISLFATLTVSAQVISPGYEPLPYNSLLLLNNNLYGGTQGTAAANDCSNFPTYYNGLLVIYVSQYTGNDYSGAYQLGHPLQSGTSANSKVQPGQLVCFEAGTYQPFTITKSGYANDVTDFSHIVRFEVIPGYIAKIDLLNCPSTTEPCWQYNSEIYNGIQIAPPSPSSSIKYVLVSGFYVQGPDEYLSGISTSYTDAQNNLNEQGAPSAYYNAMCIGINGNQPGKSYVAGGEADHIYIVANTLAGCSGGGISALFADYLTIDGNIVYDNNWYNTYGESAISVLDSLDTYPNDPNYPNNSPQGHTYKNYIVNNTVFNNIQFEPAGGNAGNSAQGSINDGEGIVIDTNLNTAADPCISGQAYCAVQPYSGWTLISNNQVWGNGSSGIEATYSQNIDITFNTTFNNGVNQNEPNRGEISDFDSLNINVGSNLTYTSGFDTSFVQGFDGGPKGGTAYYTQYYGAPYNFGIVHYFDNTALSNFRTPPTFLDAYPPIQSNDNGDQIIFANNAYAFGGAPQGSPYYGEYATSFDTVYNNGGLALAPTSDPYIQNSTRYMSLPYDILGTARPASGQTVSAGAFVVPY